MGRGVCIYTYPGGTPSIPEDCAPSVSLEGSGGIPGRCGIFSGVGCLSPSGGGAPVPLRLQHVSRFYAVPLWQRRLPSIRFSRSIAGCLSMADFTLLCPGNSTPRYCSSRTSSRGFFIRYLVCSIVARKNPPLAIFAISKARHMSDCSSCTRPPCLAIVAGMVTTYMTLVDASTYQIRLLPLLYTLPSHLLRWLQPVSCTLRDGYHEICPNNPRADSFMMVDFTNCADQCLGGRYQFPITGGNKSVTQHSMYNSCTWYHCLTAGYLDPTILTSDHMLLLFLAASAVMDNFQLCVQGHTFSCCICSVTVD